MTTAAVVRPASTSARSHSFRNPRSPLNSGASLLARLRRLHRAALGAENEISLRVGGERLFAERAVRIEAIDPAKRRRADSIEGERPLRRVPDAGEVLLLAAVVAQLHRLVGVRRRAREAQLAAERTPPG